MNRIAPRFTLLALAAALMAHPLAQAQIAGATTTMETSTTESTQVATGWSVKKTLMGKAIYNEAGLKVGKVEDLIISPDRNVSYVIVGAGGFIGIGRHDVAIPVTQIQDRSGRLVMPSATPETIKALPAFSYTSEASRRDLFAAAAERDLSKGRARVVQLERLAGEAAVDGKARIDVQITNLQGDLKSLEARLAEMRQAGEERWAEFQGGVTAASQRLRKSIDAAIG